jgi:hypothetical protein
MKKKGTERPKSKKIPNNIVREHAIALTKNVEEIEARGSAIVDSAIDPNVVTATWIPFNKEKH